MNSKRDFGVILQSRYMARTFMKNERARLTVILAVFMLFTKLPVTAKTIIPDGKDKILLTEESVGPLNKDTAFNLKTIKKLLSDYFVDKETAYIEDESYPIFKVFKEEKKGEVLLIITPSWSNPKMKGFKNIFSIKIGSNKINNLFGISIGDSLSEVYGKNEHADCKRGLGKWFSRVYCLAPGSSHI